MRLTPLYDKILIEPLPEGSVSSGGLLIPDVALKKSPFAFGEVKAVGTGRVNAEGIVVPLIVKVGDVVQYARNAGMEVPIMSDDGKSERINRLVEERYIFAIVHDLPRPSMLTGLDGRLLMMAPDSKARSDLAYENMENAAIAVKKGWAGPEDFVDDAVPFEPKE